MPKTAPPLVIPDDILSALGLLSRLPVPAMDTDHGAGAAWAYPLAGLILGALAALAGVTAHAIGLPPALSALLVLAALILLTGAMHEDGLADTADGIGGGWSREQRLDIMRDSRIGTYGVLALILAFAARWAALWLMFEAGPGTAAAAILTACTLSRATMPALMARLPLARDSGLAHGVGQVSERTAGLAIAIGSAAALIFTGWGVFGALIGVAATTLAVGYLAKTALGGQTGDVLGAAQQTAEIAILFSLLI